MIFRIIAAIFIAAPLACHAQTTYLPKDYKQYENADFGKQLAFFAFTYKAADSLLETDSQKFDYYTKAGEVLSLSVWTHLGFEQFEKALEFADDDIKKSRIHRVLGLLSIDHEELRTANKHTKKASKLLEQSSNQKEKFKSLVTEASLITAKKEDNPYANTNYDSLLYLVIDKILEIDELNFNDFETNVLIHQITTIRPFYDIPGLLEKTQNKLTSLPQNNHYELIKLLSANLLMQQYELDMVFVSKFVIDKITAEGGEDLVHMIAGYSKKYKAKYSNKDSVVARFESGEDYRLSMEIYNKLLLTDERKMVWSDLALSQADALLKNRVYIATITTKLDLYIYLYELMHTENEGDGTVATILKIAQLAAQLGAQAKGLDKNAYNKMLAERAKYIEMGDQYIRVSQEYLLKSGRQFKQLRLNNFSSIANKFDTDFFIKEYESMNKYNPDSTKYYSNTPIIRNSFRVFFEKYLKFNYQYYWYAKTAPQKSLHKKLDAYLSYDQYIDTLTLTSTNESDKFELTEDAFDIRNIAVSLSLENDVIEGWRFQHVVKEGGDPYPYLDVALYFMEKTKASSLQLELFLKDSDGSQSIENFGSVVSSTEELRSKIPLNTALVQYSIDGNRMIRMTATKDAVWFVKKDLKKDSISYLVNGFRNSIKYKLDDSYKYTARRLGKKLFPHLKKNITNVIIIPDQELNQLPFEALLYKKPKKNSTDFTTLPYVVNRYNVSYAYSSTMYLKNLNRTEQKNKILAVAPVFAKGNANTKFSLTTDLVRSSSMNLNSIQALPNTAKEVYNINGMATKKGYSVNVLKDSSANKESFLATNLKEYNIIHIASHASSDSKDYENSGILFYFEDASNPKKAILSVREIENLDLNASLVSLSACETGIGQIVKGEGVFGLGRAFFLAGTHNLLASYWKVSDASTQQLITGFYSNIFNFNYSYAKSLQISKQNLIKGGIYSHPYYWSPFVLIKG